MKRMYLTSQVQHVAQSIGKDLGELTKLPAVYITTTIHDKPHSNLEWHFKNKSSLELCGIIFDEYDISGKSESQIKSELSKYKIMYIEGGNSYYLLQESQKNNFGEYVKKRVNQGMIFIGTSAGSVIMGPDIEPVRRAETTPLAPDLKNTVAFGVVDFVVLPHWGNAEFRNLYNDYRMDHIYDEKYPYFLITDNQYVEVKDDWYKIVDVTQ